MATLRAAQRQHAESADTATELRGHGPSTTLAFIARENPFTTTARLIPASIENDHLLVDFGGRARAIVDTGSPRTIVPPREALERLGSLRWLIGTDVLARRPFTIDLPLHWIEWGVTETMGRPERLGSIGGVPTIEVAAGRSSGIAFLDTGAPISYVPRRVFRSAPGPSVEREEFYPGCGHFAVETRTIELRVAARAFDATVAVLPDAVSLKLGLTDEVWIVGVDFFRGRIIHLDLANDMLRDLTRYAAEREEARMRLPEMLTPQEIRDSRRSKRASSAFVASAFRKLRPL